MHPIVIKAIKALSLEPNAFEMPAISSMAFFMHIYSVNTAYPSSLVAFTTISTHFSMPSSLLQSVIW